MNALGPVLALHLAAAPASPPTITDGDAPGADPPATAVDPPSNDMRTRPLVLDVHGIELTPLRTSLALRLPLRPLLAMQAERPPVADYVVVERHDDAVVFTLITAEGAAFDRRITLAPGDDPLRPTATTLANLTFAIEAGEVQPDRVDVEQPPPPEPAPAPATTPPATPQPAAAPQPADPPPRPAFVPIWELGPSLDAAVVIGAAPRVQADAVAAGAGRVAIVARHRSGAAVTAGVRMAGRRHGPSGLSLLRARVEVGAGWVWRARAFELALGGALTVEPWALRRDGARAPLQLGDATARRRPLVGGALQISPGLRIAADRQGDSRLRSWLRIGPRIELAGSFVPEHGARTVDVAVASTNGTASVLRMGGLEVVLGLELVAWFGLGSRHEH